MKRPGSRIYTRPLYTFASGDVLGPGGRVGSNDGGTILVGRVSIVRVVVVIDRVQLAFSLVEGMHVGVGRKERGALGDWESGI